MALHSLELDELERLSTADPVVDPGDPDAVPPVPPTLDPDTVAMRNLRAKIRSTIIYFARQIGSGVRFEIAGRADFPDTASTSNTEPTEAAAWAQRVLNMPPSDNDLVRAAFRVALYNDVDDALSSRALTIALGAVEAPGNDPANLDLALRNAMIPLLPLLTKGLRPGA